MEMEISNSNAVTVTSETVKTNNNINTESDDYKENFMTENSYICVFLPSGNSKIVQLKPNCSISLGKFGSFKANTIIGKPFGIPYEIINKNQVNIYKNYIYYDDFDIDGEVTTFNNKNLNDTQSSQMLSHQEIEQLKQDLLKGEKDSENVIKTVLENSKTFENKTEFAKAKYIKRKERKFTKIFTPLKPTAKLLCQYFLEIKPAKIREMRIDTLSQMLTLANVHAGSNYIVVDDVHGLLLGTVLERTGGYGKVLTVHEHNQTNYNIIPYFNIPEKVYEESVMPYPWYRLLATDPFKEEREDLAKVIEFIENANGEVDEKVLIKRERLENRIATGEKINQYIKNNKFDGLLIAAGFNAVEVIKKIKPFLAGSRAVVAYSPYKEALLETYNYLRTSKDFVNAQLTESWMREHQAKKGRFHPLMSMSGSGGFLVSAIRVIDTPNLQPMSSAIVINKLKRRKERDSKKNSEESVEEEVEVSEKSSDIEPKIIKKAKIEDDDNKDEKN